MLKVWRSLGYEHYFLVNPLGLSVGLALLWNSSYDIEILYSDNRLIDTRIKTGSLVFFMSFVYSDSVRSRRRVVWDKITSIGL